MVRIPGVSNSSSFSIFYVMHFSALHSRIYLSFFHVDRFVAIMSAEGNMRSFREAVEGEPMMSEYHTMLQASMVPSVAKYAIGAVLGARVRMLFEASRKYYNKKMRVVQVCC